MGHGGSRHASQKATETTQMRDDNSLNYDSSEGSDKKQSEFGYPLKAEKTGLPGDSNTKELLKND